MRARDWRLLARAPALVVSTVLLLVIGAVHPIAQLLVGAWAGVVIVLAAGAFEAAGVRLVVGARPLTAHEFEALDVARRELFSRGLLDAPTVLCRAAGVGGVRPVGRRTLVVDEVRVLLLLGHAAAALRLGHARRELARVCWTVPWTLLTSAARAVSGHLGNNPVVCFAWRARFVVAAIAVTQAVRGDRVADGVIALVVVALTYVIGPITRRSRRECVLEADEVLIRHGLGDVLRGRLIASTQVPFVAARLRQLDDAVGAHAIARSRLTLIRGGAAPSRSTQFPPRHGGRARVGAEESNTATASRPLRPERTRP